LPHDLSKRQIIGPKFRPISSGRASCGHCVLKVRV
jgi:hypothetical protein